MEKWGLDYMAQAVHFYHSRYVTLYKKNLKMLKKELTREGITEETKEFITANISKNQQYLDEHISGKEWTDKFFTLIEKYK